MQITRTIQELNPAIDKGKYQGITMNEVKDCIKEGNLFEWLSERLGDDIHLDLDDTARREWNDKLENLRAAYGGNERRKWGVENSGLCFLVAWTTEFVQQREWED